MLSAFRRRFRSFYQRLTVLVLLVATSVVTLSYVNLEFCYRIMAQRSFRSMCKKFKEREYNGALCEELCSDSETFKDFKCPRHDMKTTVFTAIRNADVYAFKISRHIKDDLSWKDSQGLPRYPTNDDFHHIVKMHITLSFNVTLDDSMIKALVNQEIDSNSPRQMLSFWRLFHDNNYMMGKLFDEDSLFPSVLGSCGPYYATENLMEINPKTGFKHFMTIDWEGRLQLALSIMEFLFRMEEVKPEPLRICKMSFQHFGLTADKRMKYQSAEFVYAESRIDKMLSDGSDCSVDADCDWHACRGRCDTERLICVGKQQNNNLQIYCEQILMGTRFSPGLLITAGAAAGLSGLIASCVDPSKQGANHMPDRPLAPTAELGMRLFNELRRLHESLKGTAAQYDGEN